jgi:hypothetical protein
MKNGCHSDLNVCDDARALVAWRIRVLIWGSRLIGAFLRRGGSGFDNIKHPVTCDALFSIFTTYVVNADIAGRSGGDVRYTEETGAR